MGRSGAIAATGPGRSGRFRVGLLLSGIADLGAGGGAERFAAQLFSGYRLWSERRFDLELLTDQDTVERLERSGYLASRAGVRLLPNRGLLGAAFAQAAVLWRDAEPPDLVHLPLLSPRYLPYLWGTVWLKGRRPRICANVVDANLGRAFFDRRARSDGEQRRSVVLHRLYFRSVCLDGMFTWYRDWAAVAERAHARGNPLVHAAGCYFVDTTHFRPAREKERLIVYVGRFVAVKRPLLFVAAIDRLRRMAPELLTGWRIRMYGGGVLEPAVREAIARAGLDSVIEVTAATDLAPLLARSRLFVSTQANENFSSMALLEAMACGNAVVAQDVGRTAEVVEHRGNGLLVRDDTPEAFASAIREYLDHPECHERYAERSREITLTRHTAERFFGDLEDFWKRVLARPR